jgi:hypothetical protein
MSGGNPNDAKLTADLLAAIDSAGKVAPHRFQIPVEVSPGQIRQLVAYDDNLDSALVLVLAVDEFAATAKVASVSSPVIDATYRDLVVHRSVSGFPFDFTIRSDGPASAWCVQLAGTPQVGSINPEIVKLAARAPFLNNGELAVASEEIGISLGPGRPRLGDHLWWSIGRSADNLARLTAECYEAMVSEPVADPAILPALILRSDETDKAAAMAMGKALARETIQDSPETWDALDNALAVTDARDQDAMRLLERYFLERFLKADSTMATIGPEADNPASQGFEVVRELPENLDRDPLVELLGRSARAGNRSTRIWTAHHLWTTPSVVVHTVIGEHKHAVIGEFEIEAEEVLA